MSIAGRVSRATPLRWLRYRFTKQFWDEDEIRQVQLFLCTEEARLGLSSTFGSRSGRKK
jgi:hypothetical protein